MVVGFTLGQQEMSQKAGTKSVSHVAVAYQELLGGVLVLGFLKEYFSFADEL